MSSLKWNIKHFSKGDSTIIFSGLYIHSDTTFSILHPFLQCPITCNSLYEIRLFCWVEYWQVSVNTLHYVGSFSAYSIICFRINSPGNITIHIVIRPLPQLIDIFNIRFNCILPPIVILWADVSGHFHLRTTWIINFICARPDQSMSFAHNLINQQSCSHKPWQNIGIAAVSGNCRSMWTAYQYPTEIKLDQRFRLMPHAW